MAEEGGGSSQGDLRIRLVLDDGTSETFEKVKSELEGIHHEAEKTGHAVEGLFKLEALRTGFEIAKGTFEAIAETIKSGYEIAERFGQAATEAADEAVKQERAMSGTLFLLDQGEHSMEAIKEYAGEMREGLEKAGLAAGVSTAQMTEMFNTIVERGHMSSEAAGELTEQMATVGKITHGGMQSLADGFAMMELGVIRARNPLVQLIASTQLLHGNAKMVAQQLQKMTPEKQMQLAEEAVRKQAEGMKAGGGMALTLDEVRTSLSGYREMFFESMGRPMLDKLMPALTEVQHWLVENSDSLKEYAEWIGHGMGDFISGVREAVIGIYEGIESNWKRVSATFHVITDDWKAAWDYATNDSHDIRSDFKTMTEALIDAFSEIAKYVKAFGEVMMNAKDLWNKFSDEEQPGGNPNIHVGDTQIGVQEAAVAKRAQLGGGTEEQFQASMTKLERMAQQAYQGILPDDVAYKKVTDFIEAQKKFHEAEASDADKFKSRVESSNADAIGEQLREAQKTQDDAFLVNSIKTLMGSESMAVALETGAITVQGGFDALIKTVEEKSPEVAEKFKKMLAGIHSGHVEDIKGKGGVNFNIGNITIHQDFKDQDPDRVIIAFRRDLMKHATARTQARGTPFGFAGT